MRFGSVCSGIEAASAAWNPLGWRAAFLSEIDPFASAVLAHHHPTVPNLGDMTNYKDWPDATIDVLCGGTPCQSFSSAGMRAGLDDPRGQLMLTFGAIAARYRPRWLVWENVPGVLSSSGGRDFGAFLGLLGHLGYGFAYRVLDAQFVRVDGYARAVPQRRQRVFVVGCLGDWRSAAAVLLERESLRGDLAPRRRPGETVAPCSRAGAANGGPGHGARSGDSKDELIVAHTLRGEGFDISGTLEAAQSKGNRGHGVLAFDTTQITSAANRSNPKPGDPCHTLAAGAHAPAVAFGWQNAAAQGMAVDTISPTLDKSKHPATATAAAVRRLMPVECERLQGFPDGHTAIVYRGKAAADGPRYRALGNSWAVNCARWLGRRIEAVDSLKPHNLS
jgi:DNA (cytosine-5)-methyltransferase 1